MKTGQTILVGADEAPSFRPMNLTNPKVGVILARFQPIHNGHLALIEKACKISNFLSSGFNRSFSSYNTIFCTWENIPHY